MSQAAPIVLESKLLTSREKVSFRKGLLNYRHTAPTVQGCGVLRRGVADWPRSSRQNEVSLGGGLRRFGQVRGDRSSWFGIDIDIGRQGVRVGEWLKASFQFNLLICIFKFQKKET